jgi:multimeric flavodoxin WrbA
MKVLAINGSPRKKWNTATLLQNTLDGAASAGAETELVHLYDLTFTGCTSCFACKLAGGKSYGKCAVQDGLTPVLEEIPDLDALGPWLTNLFRDGYRYDAVLHGETAVPVPFIY